jgi:nitrite reductase/ring-hydroxylating ferredoxin subunit/Fe-S cluster biogenesis protein NfuA
VTATAESRPAVDDFEGLARRVDDAVTALAGLDPASRAVADEVKAAVEAVHRAGLVTIVRRLREDPATRAVLFDLVDDPVVHLLLSLHEIIRPDPVTHANQVLTAVRPQLQSHGGDVTLVRVQDGTASVRLEGACNGCSMSSVTLRNLVESALIEGVPAITAVEVLPNEPSPTLIPLESLRIGRPDDGWARVGSAAEIADGALTVSQAQGAEVIVVSVDHRLSAYRNECAHEALPLDNAILDVENGTLTCPWHGFCFDAGSGECLSAPGAQLEQLPLRVDGGEVWVRVQA